MCPKPKRSAGWVPGQEPVLFERIKLGLVALVVTSIPVGSFFALFNSEYKMNETSASPSPRPTDRPVEASPSPQPTHRPVEASPTPHPEASPSATPLDVVLTEFTPTPTPPKKTSAPQPKPTPKADPKPTTPPAQKPTPVEAQVPAGLSGTSPSVQKIGAATEQLFPAAGPYGGYRAADVYGEHSTGKAIDIMVPNKEVGQEIADYFKAHAKEYNIKHIIWNQHIWSVERSSEGWRPMEDRGSPTQNHEDHNHILTN